MSNNVRALSCVNFLAKYSVKKWNKIRLLRKVCRLGYQWLGRLYTFIASFRLRPTSYLDDRVRTFQGLDIVDTYPWPYVDPGFAPWADDDMDCLIPDSVGFVRRRSTSYCAWKIREATGKWPRRAVKRRYDAKDWQEFLAGCGYTTIVSGMELVNSRRYVGIIPSDGEFGLVVWAHALYHRQEADDRIEEVVCSTYRDGHFEILVYPRAEPIIWVQIA